MRSFFWGIVLGIGLVATGVGPALAQTDAPQDHGSSLKEQTGNPPVDAPRTPARRTVEPRPRKPPVVSPRRPTRPQRAGSAKTPAQAAAPTPSAATPPAATPPNQPAPEKLAEPEKPEGAKLPRFASLRSDDVNMRAGPGTRYRIEWVYKRRYLPMEIEREFDVWRWVRDPDGIQGWIHQATLMGRRSFVVQRADATLRREPNDAAKAVAILKPGVIGQIRSCQGSSEWCGVQTGSFRGYLRRDQFWGVLRGEAIAP